jgi:hypothetical protein
MLVPNRASSMGLAAAAILAGQSLTLIGGAAAQESVKAPSMIEKPIGLGVPSQTAQAEFQAEIAKVGKTAATMCENQRPVPTDLVACFGQNSKSLLADIDRRMSAYMDANKAALAKAQEASSVAKAESAQLKAESAQLKAESAQLKAESAQLKAESAASVERQSCISEIITGIQQRKFTKEEVMATPSIQNSAAKTLTGDNCRGATKDLRSVTATPKQ